MPVDRNAHRDSLQELGNLSFDDTYKINSNLIYGKQAGVAALQPISVNADGELVVNLEASTINIGDVDVVSSVTPGLGIPPFDAATTTYNATSDVWVFTLATVTKATVTVNYTDATKATISSVVKT